MITADAIADAHYRLRTANVSGPFRAVIPVHRLPREEQPARPGDPPNAVVFAPHMPVVEGVEIITLPDGDVAFVEGRNGVAEIREPGLRIGESVYLKGQSGPRMTVTRVYSDAIEVMWFQHGDTLQKASVDPAALERQP